MKRLHFAFLACFLLLFSGSLQAQGKKMIEKNLKIATLYHELNPDNVDLILTEGFNGQNEQGRHTWDRESHRRYLSNGNFKQDSIFQQVAQGDWVATRFVRTMDWKGMRVKAEMMQFKHFKDGKIDKIWEYGDTAQVTDLEEE